MSDHARLAPSAAPQWGYCSGSVLAQSAVPNVDSEQSRVGTAAHWVGESVLRTWASPGTDLAQAVDYLDRPAPNGVVIDEEMVEGAQVFVDDVMSVCSEQGGLTSLMVEHRVHAPQIHADNWGTLDAALFRPEKNRLYIWDYKHGHRVCNATENLQLINYAGGLVNELRINGAQEQAIDVHFRIVQPFAYRSGGPVDEWVVRLSDLRGWFNLLHSQAGEVDNNPATTSGAHCRDCAAVGRCVTAKAASYSVIHYVKEPYQIDTMSSADVAIEMGILSTGETIIKARREAIEDDLKQRVVDGDQGSGYVLQGKVGRLDWTVPAEQAVALGAQFGVDINKPTALTPTQAVKAAPIAVRKMFEGVVKTISAKPARGTELVKLKDSRTANAFKPK